MDITLIPTAIFMYKGGSSLSRIASINAVLVGAAILHHQRSERRQTQTLGTEFRLVCVVHAAENIGTLVIAVSRKSHISLEQRPMTNKGTTTAGSSRDSCRSYITVVTSETTSGFQVKLEPNASRRSHSVAYGWAVVPRFGVGKLVAMARFGVAHLRVLFVVDIVAHAERLAIGKGDE